MLASEVVPPKGMGYYRLGKNKSLQSDLRCKVGAVLVDKRPVSVGYNKLKSHPEFAVPGKHIKISIHAEIDCIIKAKRDVKGLSIYVYREDRHGNIANSRPCEQCMKELKRRGIKRVYYTSTHYPYYREEKIN